MSPKDAKMSDPGYTLVRRHWWSRRRDRLWHREPNAPSGGHGFLITEELARRIEAQGR